MNVLICRSTIKDKIIPHAVSWFTGEAVQDDDELELENDEEEDEEEDEDEEEEDDEDEDDEDEDEEDKGEAKSAKKVLYFISKSFLFIFLGQRSCADVFAQLYYSQPRGRRCRAEISSLFYGAFNIIDALFLSWLIMMVL